MCKKVMLVIDTVTQQKRKRCPVHKTILREGTGCPVCGYGVKPKRKKK